MAAWPPTPCCCGLPPSLSIAGRLYIADTGAQRVRQVLPTGVIRTLAGTGVAGSAADNVLASAATFNGPSGVAVDSAGDIVIADEWNQRVRQVTADGRIHNLVGTGNTGPPVVGTPAKTPLSEPYGVCTGRGGALFVVVWGSNVVFQAAPQALVITAAGNGTPAIPAMADRPTWRSSMAQRLRPGFRRQPLHRQHLEPPHPQSGPYRHDFHGCGHRRARFLRRRRPRHRCRHQRSAGRRGGR